MIISQSLWGRYSNKKDQNLIEEVEPHAFSLLRRLPTETKCMLGIRACPSYPDLGIDGIFCVGG